MLTNLARHFTLLIFFLSCDTLVFSQSLDSKGVRNDSLSISASKDSFLIRGLLVFAKSNNPIPGSIYFFYKDKYIQREYKVNTNYEGEFELRIGDIEERKFKTMRFTARYWEPDRMGIDYKLTQPRIRLHNYRHEPLILKLTYKVKTKTKISLRGTKLADLANSIDNVLFYSVLPSFNFNFGRNYFSEIGLTYSPALSGFSSHVDDLFSNFYVKAAVEFNHKKPHIFGPKLSFHYRYLGLVESGINSILYIHKDQTKLVIRPETGISFFGFAGIVYGYNIRMSKDQSLNPYINRHNISLFIRLILK